MKRFSAFLSVIAILIATLSLFGCTGKIDESHVGHVDPIEFSPSEIKDVQNPNRYDDLMTAFRNSPPAKSEELKYTKTQDSVTITGIETNPAVLVIPSEVEGLPVVNIAEDAFADNMTLTAVCIPDTVNCIGPGAFAGCDNIKTLKIPLIVGNDQLFASIFGAKNRFDNAIKTPDALETLILTGNNTEVPDYAFFECGKVKNIILPDSVIKLGKFSFYDCNNLEYIYYGKSLTEIGEHALAFCSDLTYIDLPDTVTSIGIGAFEDCGKITGITSPIIGGGDPDSSFLGYIFGAKYYSWSAGYVPHTLQHVVISSPCKSIPANAFFECNSIVSISVPDGLSDVGVRAFYGCFNLREIDLKDSVKIGDEAFYNCYSLAKVTANSATEVGLQCFYSCSALKTVSLKSCEKLGNLAFGNCTSLTEFDCPKFADRSEKYFKNSKS